MTYVLKLEEKAKAQNWLKSKGKQRHFSERNLHMTWINKTENLRGNKLES